MSDNATSPHNIQQEDAKMKWGKPQFTVISSGQTEAKRFATFETNSLITINSTTGPS